MRLSSTCESEEKKSKERGEEEEKKKGGTGGGKMKRAPHGASGGALWNAASEGRMKALVTSHHTKSTHAHTHSHTHNLAVVQQRRTVPLSRALKRIKCKGNEKEERRTSKKKPPCWMFHFDPYLS